jgi:hypothetical protein
VAGAPHVVTLAPSPVEGRFETMGNDNSPRKGVMMTPIHREELTQEQLDAIAWQFFRSEFASQRADWPIDRRVDAFLLHDRPAGLVNDGASYNALLERIMANIRPALRTGVLRSPSR